MRLRASIAVLSILIAICAEASQGGCGAAPAVKPGATETLSIRIGDLGREYRLHLPAGYDAEKPTPLVLAFHGYGRTAASFEERTQLSAQADARGFIAVYPQATSFDNGQMIVTSWNDLTCNASPGPEGPTCIRKGDDPIWCPPECGECGDCNWCSCHDDVAFVAALLDELEASLCVDAGRVYATGFSNGAMLVYRLGCDLTERFAAVAPVSGLPNKGFKCAPPAPLSLMHVHGLGDDVVPATGEASRFGALFTPIEEMIDRWASSQDCGADAVPYPSGTEWECASRPDCATDSEVAVCRWDGGHDWPESGADVLWEFFRQHTRNLPAP